MRFLRYTIPVTCIAIALAFAAMAHAMPILSVPDVIIGSKGGTVGFPVMLTNPDATPLTITHFGYQLQVGNPAEGGFVFNSASAIQQPGYPNYPYIFEGESFFYPGGDISIGAPGNPVQADDFTTDFPGDPNEGRTLLPGETVNLGFFSLTFPNYNGSSLDFAHWPMFFVPNTVSLSQLTPGPGGTEVLLTPELGNMSVLNGTVAFAPEPGSVALFALAGGLALAGTAMRRRRAALYRRLHSA